MKGEEKECKTEGMGKRRLRLYIMERRSECYGLLRYRTGHIL